MLLHLQKPAVRRSIPALPSRPHFPVIPTAALTHWQQLPGIAYRDFALTERENGKVVSWMNPASIVHKGARYLAYRTECRPIWRWSKLNLCRLGQDMRPIPGTNRQLSIPTRFGDTGAEDPRLFEHEGRLWLAYTDAWAMGLAELNADGEVLQSHLFPARRPELPPRGPRDKNWGFFSYRGELFASRWPAPHQVSRCDLDAWTIDRTWQSDWPTGWNFGELHGGSSPAFHDGLFWRVVHSRIAEPGHPNGETYHLAMMAFDPAPPFRVRWFSSRPFLSGEPEPPGQPIAVHHRVVFCSSCERVDGGWLIFFGENDLRMRHGIVSDADLTANLRRV